MDKLKPENQINFIIRIHKTKTENKGDPLLWVTKKSLTNRPNLISKNHPKKKQTKFNQIKPNQKPLIICQTSKSTPH
jgi:hypothetical protein